MRFNYKIPYKFSHLKFYVYTLPHSGISLGAIFSEFIDSYFQIDELRITEEPYLWCHHIEYRIKNSQIYIPFQRLELLINERIIVVKMADDEIDFIKSQRELFEKKYKLI